jgi:hypothetical protein
MAASLSLLLMAVDAASQQLQAPMAILGARPRGAGCERAVKGEPGNDAFVDSRGF